MTFFYLWLSETRREVIMCQFVRLDLSICCLLHLSVLLPWPAFLKVRMLGEHNELEKSVEEVLKTFMDDKAMSKGVQMSFTRGLRASPSTGWRYSHTNPVTKQWSKYHEDMENAKQILSILLDYIPTLAGVVNHENIPWDFQYTLITAYTPKGIRIVGSQLGQIPLLKNNDLNLGDRKKYVMLAPHKYLMKTIGKRLHLVSQPWIKELAQSTILNVMKIPHFGRH